MDKDSRFIAIQNMAEALDSYRETIEQLEKAKSYAKTEADYFTTCVDMLDRLAETQKRLILSLYENALL